MVHNFGSIVELSGGAILEGKKMPLLYPRPVDWECPRVWSSAFYTSSLCDSTIHQDWEALVSSITLGSGICIL